MPTETKNESGLTDIEIGPNKYALTILYAMNRLGKHIYEGTVPAGTKAKRRAANKVARAQRKINRG